MKNNKGFISMTLVYSFLTLFLFIMAGIMASQSEKFDFMDYVNEKVGEDIENMKDKSSTLMQRLLEDNFVTDGTRFEIGKIANSDVGNGNGLYYVDNATITDEDDNRNTARIYFFRGTVENNYVLLKKNNSGAYCFKIIRTNEDGNIRMMFIGNAKNGNCNLGGDATGIGNSNFSDKKNDNAFVGYMLGKSETELGEPFSARKNCASGLDSETCRRLNTHYYFDGDLNPSSTSTSGLQYFKVKNNAVEYHERESLAKRTVDKWYEDNLLSIAFMFTDSIFCADKTITSGPGYGPGSGSEESAVTIYYDKNRTEFSYKCENEMDRLSLSQFNGGTNQNYNSLKYPVGLPTVMDVIYAGGQFCETGTDSSCANTKYYMHTGKAFWTMTPYSYGKNSDTTYSAHEVYVGANGRVWAWGVAPSTVPDIYLYPVVSIKPDAIVGEGSGTASMPYVIDVSTN